MLKDVGFELICINTNFIALGMNGITKRRDSDERKQWPKQRLGQAT